AILNPSEFDLWKMRIEQYFLMTDYSLWEVIINGESPVPTIVVDGVVQPVAHRSAEQKLARRNELKACGNSTQNLVFVSSNTDNTTDSVSAATSVSAVCAKLHNRVLVTKPHNKTTYELLHGRTPSIGFIRPFGCLVTILNTFDPLGKFEGKVDERFLVGYSVNSFQDKFNADKAGEEVNQQYMLFPVWSSGSSNPQNKDGDAAFHSKEHNVDTKKPESAVKVSPSSRNRDFSAEFEYHSDNSKNDVNATGSIVPTAGQNSSNSTNPFSAVGPSNTIASPTHGKSSFKDASQLPDNPDMLEMEDITYSNHKNVGAEADFNNLETSITVSPIPTTRIHKDHPVSQIIGDLSSTTQIRSMTRVIKDQGGLSQIFNDDFHTCMFACFLSQEEPRRVKQKKDGIFISQDKYVAEILKKFGLTEGKSASTPIDTEKPLLKDPDGEDVDVHIYRSMIGSLMYLTSSRPDIMFAIVSSGLE
nr:uncharacterized mitochondrial protein AtMg00810-like [Tanacetum cinerariifolium]